MKILFICSGNSFSGISPVILSQGKSLVKQGVYIEYFTISNKGFLGYIKSIFQLKKFVRNKSYDIYHAHYGLSAIVATLAARKPLFVSLMGSDVKKGGWQLLLIKLFSKYNWDMTIAKSEELVKIINNKKALVLPNGVDISIFYPINKIEAKRKIGLNANKNYILFAANHNRPEKNYQLAKQAFDLLNLENYEFLTLNNLPIKKVPFYINAANTVILTSFWEGSPNVIKEAMACNIPIVSTDVGDVRWLFNNVSGCFLSEFNVSDVVLKLKSAIKLSNSNGREKILQLKLDSDSVAKKIKTLYFEKLN